MTTKWPCPCCGHLTLTDGPGDYALCPVCFWEDDGEQLRWPLSDHGANGISLVDAQRNYQRYGACHEDFHKKVRPPQRGERLDLGWRPLDLAVDDVERDPSDPGRPPWPADSTRLYWWRDTYYRAPGGEPVNLAPAADALIDPSPAERLMARILAAVPEARVIEDSVRGETETPGPFLFCHRLADLAIGAFESGNDDLAERLLGALNTGLTDGDAFAHNCVGIAFLEDRRWHSPEVESFIARWPPEIRAEITSQREHAAHALAEVLDIANFNRELATLRSGAPALDHGEIKTRFRDLTRSHCLPFGEAEIELFARLMRDERWPSHHPIGALHWAWRHRRSATLRRRLVQLRTRSVHFAG